MKSLLKYASSFKTSARNRFTGERRKSRKSSSSSNTSYQTLEKRNLLATLTVTTALDVVANDGLVSLREAITATNTNAAFSDTAAGDATGDRIRFASSLAGQTIQLTAGEFEITDDVVIVGDVTLDAQNQSRILNIDTSENVVLSQLTFINGNVGDEFGARDGGAIYISEGNLQISAAEFRSNSAANSGGAILSLIHI